MEIKLYKGQKTQSKKQLNNTGLLALCQSAAPIGFDLRGLGSRKSNIMAKKSEIISVRPTQKSGLTKASIEKSFKRIKKKTKQRSLNEFIVDAIAKEINNHESNE